ncbi:MAG TPA: amino acid permease [Candidatus Nitrosotenuis sp.]|nr:amino acid permease [Candidatus Nitrosotenuis sp.]
MASEPARLIRGLGPWAAMAIVVGTMIGTGIFLKPSVMARDTGSIFLIFAAWIIGGALSLAGALSYAELGAALPEAGGEYPYLRRGLGEKWAFMFGWMHSIVGRPASAASIAAGLLLFGGFLQPAVKTEIFAFDIPRPWADSAYTFKFTWAQPLAALVIMLVTFVNYLGVRLGGQIQVFLTFIKLAAVAAVLVLGLALSSENPTAFQPMMPENWNGATLAGFFAALAAALWAYDGWNNINLVGSEVKDPQRNIPLSLVGGVSFVMLAYLLTTSVFFYALPFGDVADKNFTASTAIERFAGANAAKWFTLALVCSALGTLNSSILSGARVPYAMAKEGVFFRVTAGVHPQYHTPGGALILQGILAGLVVLTGSFDELTDLYIFAQWIFYALTTSVVFWLRKKEPDLPRPYRTWGYPVVPALFLIGAAALTVNLWMKNPGRSTAGIAFILLGLVFFWIWKKRLKATAASRP